MDLLPPDLEAYLEGLHPEPDPARQAMEALAAERQFPIVGPLVGQLLFLLARLIGARRILELGSGFGYSAWWFARALPEDGVVITTEGSADLVARARGFFAQAGLASRLEAHVGDGLEVIDALPGEFDLIFCDVDKHQYPDAFARALPRLRTGGLLVADNTLWFGRVLDADPDAATAGIQAWNRLIFSTPGLHSTILPLRDGVSVSLKRAGAEPGDSGGDDGAAPGPVV